ncbi:MAG TPA: calcium-binding protein, partial [Candidatus Dormibacteraeota bacterium]|nr:calcium-binding protein [Candidatus Dormibacteraeota bacterium]
MLSAVSTIKGEAFKALTGSDAAKNAVKVPGMIATETLNFAQLRAAGASNAAAAVITASGVVGKLSGAVMGAIVGAAATGPAAPVAAAVLGLAAAKVGGDIGTTLGGIIANAFGLPLVVDLDGDGVDLVSLAQSRTFFDMRGDGFREHTGWVGAGDGLLVVDFNHNGQVDDINEISFARFGAPGATDLEGLAAGFDSNHDGVIDARDARFGELMVWQDANQNGQTDAGELKSLTDLGITSIGLDRRSPASVETASALDNFLFGTSTFTRADGSVGAVGDVALGFVNSGLRSEPATGDGVGWLRDESGALIEVITGPITGNLQPPAGDVVGVIGSSAAEQLSVQGTQGGLLDGEGGNDSLTGGVGDDWLIGGAGSDSLSGGPGDDVLFIDAEDRQADIDGGDGKDMVIVGGATGVTFDLGAAHVEMAKGGEGNDTLLTTGADAIIANGGAGNDTLVGGPGEDILEGGPGADTLIGGAGDDILVIDGQDSVDAGDGTDTVIIDDPAGVTLDLAAAHAELAFGGAG